MENPEDFSSFPEGVDEATGELGGDELLGLGLTSKHPTDMVGGGEEEEEWAEDDEALEGEEEESLSEDGESEW